jgi:hypothetical protein
MPTDTQEMKAWAKKDLAPGNDASARKKFPNCFAL